MSRKVDRDEQSGRPALSSAKGLAAASADPGEMAGELSSSLLAMCVADAERRLLFVSEPLVRMWGYQSSGEAVGRRLEEFLEEGDHAATWALLELNGEAHGDVRARRADGSSFDVAFVARLVRNVDGAALYTVATFLDVTEDRRAEEQLRHAQRMDAVGQLAAGAAHDLNNQLMAISSHADLLRLKLGPGSPLSRHVDEIKDATMRAAHLVDKMLAYGKRQLMRPEQLDPNLVVSGLEERFREIVGARAKLEIELADDVGSVRADRRQLERAVLNLVENARDALGGGVGSVRIETTGVDGDEGARWAAIAVTDTGEGLDEDALEHAFEPFFTTRPPGTGHSGLGLAQVWGIVEQSGGTVSIDSTPGQGSSFRMLLPSVSAARDVELEGQERPAETDEQVTVLVAEDDERVRKALNESLRELGYSVLEAGSADEAVLVADGFGGTIDVLVTDLVMPGIPVEEMVERLASGRPELAVLRITANRDQDGGRPFPGGGRSAVLLKPFSLQDLARSLRGLLEARSRDRP